MSVAIEHDPRHARMQWIYTAATNLWQLYGVKVSWSDTLEVAVHWDGARRLVLLAADMPLEDQAWAIAQVWTLCTAGRQAVPAAVTLRHLSVV